MAAHLQGITCSSCSDHTNQETGTHYSCCHQPYCAMLLAWLDTVCRYAIEVYVVTHSWGIYIPTLHAGCYINPYHSFTPLSFVHDTNDSDTSWSSYSTIALCVHQQDYNRCTLLQLVVNVVGVGCVGSECTSAVVLIDILWMCIMMAMCSSSLPSLIILCEVEHTKWRQLIQSGLNRLWAMVWSGIPHHSGPTVPTIVNHWMTPCSSICEHIISAYYTVASVIGVQSEV